MSEHKMECHITDGPQTPEDVEQYTEVDEDAAYEEVRQQEIDDEREFGTCTDRFELLEIEQEMKQGEQDGITGKTERTG